MFDHPKAQPRPRALVCAPAGNRLKASFTFFHLLKSPSSLRSLSRLQARARHRECRCICGCGLCVGCLRPADQKVQGADGVYPYDFFHGIDSVRRARLFCWQPFSAVASSASVVVGGSGYQSLFNIKVWTDKRKDHDPPPTH